jgi:hypothetical protein
MDAASAAAGVMISAAGGVDRLAITSVVCGAAGTVTTVGAGGAPGATITEALPAGVAGTTAVAGPAGVTTTADDGALWVTTTVVLVSPCGGGFTCRDISSCAEAGEIANIVIAAASTGSVANAVLAESIARGDRVIVDLLECGATRW